MLSRFFYICPETIEFFSKGIHMWGKNVYNTYVMARTESEERRADDYQGHSLYRRE